MVNYNNGDEWMRDGERRLPFNQPTSAPKDINVNFVNPKYEPKDAFWIVLFGTVGWGAGRIFHTMVLWLFDLN